MHFFGAAKVVILNSRVPLRLVPNPSCQYSKRQTRGEEIEKCLDEGLEPTYYFSIFNSVDNQLN